VILSVVTITHNEEANIGRTLESVKPLVSDGKGEIIVVDSGSTDGTVEIAKSHGAKVFVEPWKGFAAQKNSAIDKAAGDWVLSLDADEEVDRSLVEEIFASIKESGVNGFLIQRQNHFLGRWIKHGGFWPDPKLRLFRRATGRFQDQVVHETIKVDGRTSLIQRGALIHHSYPTMSDYISHMNRYSSLGAEMVVAKGRRHLLLFDITLRPLLTFIYNYFFRLGFLDGREGFLLHVGHVVYVSWKYAKVWELQNTRS
jgi:glycosyltransferase involved in cell wall biosynthesis